MMLFLRWEVVPQILDAEAIKQAMLLEKKSARRQNDAGDRL
jgi:hypothetical protein